MKASMPSKLFSDAIAKLHAFYSGSDFASPEALCVVHVCKKSIQLESANKGFYAKIVIRHEDLEIEEQGQACVKFVHLRGLALKGKQTKLALQGSKLKVNSANFRGTLNTLEGSEVVSNERPKNPPDLAISVDTKTFTNIVSDTLYLPKANVIMKLDEDKLLIQANDPFFASVSRTPFEFVEEKAQFRTQVVAKTILAIAKHTKDDTLEMGANASMVYFKTPSFEVFHPCIEVDDWSELDDVMAWLAEITSDAKPTFKVSFLQAKAKEAVEIVTKVIPMAYGSGVDKFLKFTVKEDKMFVLLKDDEKFGSLKSSVPLQKVTGKSKEFNISALSTKDFVNRVGAGNLEMKSFKVSGEDGPVILSNVERDILFLIPQEDNTIQ